MGIHNTVAFSRTILLLIININDVADLFFCWMDVSMKEMLSCSAFQLPDFLHALHTKYPATSNTTSYYGRSPTQALIKLTSYCGASPTQDVIGYRLISTTSLQ